MLILNLSLSLLWTSCSDISACDFLQNYLATCNQTLGQFLLPLVFGLVRLLLSPPTSVPVTPVTLDTAVLNGEI